MFPFAVGLVLNIHRFPLISNKYFLFFLISALVVLLYYKRADKRAARIWAEVFSTALNASVIKPVMYLLTVH